MWTRTTRGAAAVLATFVVLATGCATSGGAATDDATLADPPAPATDPPATDADPPATEADPPATDADPPAADAAPADPPATEAPRCDPEVDEAVEATITGQLAAFAADDYDEAFGFATRDFQASMDVTTFQRMIDDAYPEVADSVGHRLAHCLRVGDDVVHVTVTVTGRDGGRAELLYVLVAERDGTTPRWAVAAAASRPAEPGVAA